jgi:arsenate reductase (glutaredoxin)
MNPDLVIYHNPRCSKSRQALEILRQHGHEPCVIEYLKTPPDLQTLRSFGLPARDLLRDNEPEFAALKLDAPGQTDADLFAAIVAHPVLLQRPIVVRGHRALIARPPERVTELL